jgi:hypothetical protein
MSEILPHMTAAYERDDVSVPSLPEVFYAESGGRRILEILREERD